MLLVTFEILVCVVAPLLILYLRSPWPERVTIPCLIVIPLLWYLTYSPIHELSHVLGTYVAGGTVTGIKLIPSFWHGEFGRAWITPQGLSETWQQFVMTGAPYILDGLSIAVGFVVLRGALLHRSFVIGITFMLLCLRPAFDLVCETVAFAQGTRGDLYHIAKVTGRPGVWFIMMVLTGFAVLTIVCVLRRSTVNRQNRAT